MTKTVRLTQSIREEIATAVVRHRFSDEIGKLIADRAVFASDLYSDIYRPADREKMEALPKGWLPESGHVGAQFGESGSQYQQIEFNGRIGYGRNLNIYNKTEAKLARIERRCLRKHEHGCWKVYAADHKLSKRWAELKAAQSDIERRVYEAEMQAKGALRSANTVAGLVAGWPEIEPFTKGYCVLPSRLPAIPVAKLNELFKLPVSKAA